MSSETKTLSVLVGTIVGTAIAMTTVITTSIGGRMTNLENELRTTRTELREEIRATRGELREEIRATRDELREEIRLLDGRVRTVETGFARVDQRLETIEHAVIPAAEAPQ